MESKRNTKYEVWEPNQKEILMKYYEKGMASTTLMKDIQEAAKESRVPVNRIKKWIGNYRAKNQKRKTENSEQLSSNMQKRVKGERKLTAHNVFYSRLSKQGKLNGLKSNAERHIFVTDLWRTLDEDTRQSCSEEAARINNMEKLQLSEEETKRLIQRHKKKLCLEVAALETLGVDSFAIIAERGGAISNFGSQQGVDFLASTQKINLSFKDFLAKHVTYLHGNFEIIGIPDSISWRKHDGKVKKPTDYGQLQIDEIMRNKEKISFIIHDNSHNEQSQNEVDPPVILPPLLWKIVSESAVREAMSGIRKIDESEVEVCFALRREEEEELLKFYQDLFTEDAIKLINSNFDQKSSGVVVPTYTKRKGSFWLFYYDGRLEDITNLQGDVNIPGLWLDHKKGCQYLVLSGSSVIKYQNIVFDKAQSKILYLERNLSDYVGKVVTMDKDFLRHVKQTM
eukprot:gene10511-11615_t